MLTIKGKSSTVTKTLRMPEHMAAELERIAAENRTTFTSVVEQCIEYALNELDGQKQAEQNTVREDI